MHGAWRPLIGLPGDYCPVVFHGFPERQVGTHGWMCCSSSARPVNAPEAVTPRATSRNADQRLPQDLLPWARAAQLRLGGFKIGPDDCAVLVGYRKLIKLLAEGGEERLDGRALGDNAGDGYVLITRHCPREGAKAELPAQ